MGLIGGGMLKRIDNLLFILESQKKIHPSSRSQIPPYEC